MRTSSCVTFERVESSPVLVFDEKDLPIGCATEVEAEHRRNKRNREGAENQRQEEGEGGGAAAAAAVEAEEVLTRSHTIRRLSYDDNEDVLGIIAQLPDDGAVEEEPNMTQTWNQDSESQEAQLASPQPLTQPLTPVPLTQPAGVAGIAEDDVEEEGEIRSYSSNLGGKSG